MEFGSFNFSVKEYYLIGRREVCLESINVNILESILIFDGSRKV